MVSADAVMALVKLGFMSASLYITYKISVKILASLDDKEDSMRQVDRKKLNIPDNIELTKYEARLASMLVPEEEGVDWRHIGGYHDVIRSITSRLIIPLRRGAALLKNKLLKPSKGILLYGPPGCGKTLIARAVARSANARFINVDVSLLTDKWYGETPKLCAALFTLARKLQPTIIFIDEIDSFLRQRSQYDDETSTIMKTQFMMYWDGFASTDDRIVIMGATNRPEALDEAIRRRLPMTFLIDKPDIQARAEIYKILLQLTKHKLTDEHIDALAERSAGLSGAEIKEVCNTAALTRFSATYHMDDDDDHESDPLDEELILEFNDLDVALDQYLNERVTLISASHKLI